MLYLCIYIFNDSPFFRQWYQYLQSSSAQLQSQISILQQERLELSKDFRWDRADQLRWGEGQFFFMNNVYRLVYLYIYMLQVSAYDMV